MYWSDALMLPLRFSFIHRNPSRTEAQSLPKTSSTDKAAVNPENASQDAGFKTIDQRVRALIIGTNGDSELVVQFNISLMGRHWHRIFYRYSQDPATAAW